MSNLKFWYNKELRPITESRQKYLREQVEKLKNIPQPEQRSKEWYEMRDSMLTASDWGTILGENPYSKGEAVLLKKCGDDTPFPSNDAIRWGIKYEPVANLIYEYRNQTTVLEFGCIRHPTIPFLGASPDGITVDGVMLEIKCPSSREITGETPRYYWCQVQGQLEVCELDRCDFLECKIKEYEYEDQYYCDHYQGDITRNSFGNEKGVVVEYFRISDKTYFYDYSPVGIIDSELDEWKRKMEIKYINNKDEIVFGGFCYWYLEIVSCVPIYRNQEWFNTAYYVLESFWNDILKYRSIGLLKLKEDIQQRKDEKKLLKLTNSSTTDLSSGSSKKTRTPSANKKPKKESINISMLQFVETERTKEDFDYDSSEEREITALSASTSFFSDDQ